MGALNPKFTESFEVSTGNYGDFISNKVRPLVAGYCRRHHGVDRPVLPPEEEIPNLWFHIILRTKTSSLTLAIRMDNLYLVSFKTPSGVWWEFGKEGDTQLISNSRWLGFGGSFKDLAPKGKLHTTPLGREQMSYAVDSLAKYPTGLEVDDEDDDPHKTQKKLLAGLVIVLCEGLRFLTVSGTVDKKFDVIPATIDEIEGKQVKYWDKISKAVFTWAVDPSAKFPELEEVGIRDKNDAAGIISLVKDQTSTGENKDEP